MAQKYSHQLITGISFGLTTAVITSLGMIVGIHSATSPKLAVVAEIAVMAIADGLSDAVSLHTAEEAEVEEGRSKHTPREIWLTTLFAFLSVSSFILTSEAAQVSRVKYVMDADEEEVEKILS